MTRSGIETTLSAVLNSGFFSNKLECSRVETSSRTGDQTKVIQTNRPRLLLTLVRLFELGFGWKVRHCVAIRCLSHK